MEGLDAVTMRRAWLFGIVRKSSRGTTGSSRKRRSRFCPNPLRLPSKTGASPQCASRLPRASSVAKRLLAMAASFDFGAGAEFLAMRETSATRTAPIVREMPAVPAVAQTPRHSPEIERAYRIAAAAEQTNR